MNCKKFRKHLNSFIEGELGQTIGKLIEEHKIKCPLCAQEWFKTKKMFNLLQSLPRLNAPSYFEAQLNQKLDEKPVSAWDRMVSYIPLVWNKKLRVAMYSLSLGILFGGIVFISQDYLNEKVAEKQVVDNQKNHTLTHEKLAGIGYLQNEDGSFQFPEIKTDVSTFYNREQPVHNISTQNGVQPANIIEVNF